MSLPAEFGLARLREAIREVAQQPDFTSIGTVRRVIAVDGQPAAAIVDFPGETGVEVRLGYGIGTPTLPGMTVRAARHGGIIDPTWVIIEVLSGPRISFGEPVAALLPTPVLPGATSGGVSTESNTGTAANPNAIADPSAPVRARVYLLPRAVVPGSYAAYQARAQGFRVQARELGTTDWLVEQDVELRPASYLRASLHANITSTSTAITVNVPSDRVAEVIVGRPAFWMIDGEVLRARAATTGTPGRYDLTVVTHDGLGDATRNAGFTASATGRGLEGTAAEAHTAGALVVCLSAIAVVSDLRPNVAYEIRAALINAARQAGPYSGIVSLTSWTQPIAPAAPANLVVEHVASAINVKWDRVITDANGAARSDVKRYIVARFTAALTASFTLAQVISAGATVIGEDINSNVIAVPATKGFGNFVGVAAVGADGLLSTWNWQQDDLAPPYPDPADVEITSIQNGVFVSIPLDSDSRHARTGATVSAPAQHDQGFDKYVLWKASSNSGTGAVPVGFFQANSTPIYFAGGTTGYYKVTSMDLAGNTNGPATYPAGIPLAGQSNLNTHGWASNWKFVWSRFAESTFPQNGNFQDANSDETAPRYWLEAHDETNGFSVDYLTDGGINGNRVYRLRWNGSINGAGGRFIIESTRQPIPAGKTPTFSLWLKASKANVRLSAAYPATTLADSFTAEGSIGIVVYDINGTLLGSYSTTTGPSLPYTLPNNQWVKVSFVAAASIVSGLSLNSAATGALMLELRTVYTNSPATTSTFDLLVDAVEVDWS